MFTPSPCNGCQDRRQGCHNPAVCEKWGEWTQVHEKEKEAERAAQREHRSQYYTPSRRKMIRELHERMKKQK